MKNHVDTKIAKILGLDASKELKLLKLYGLGLSLAPHSPNQEKVKKAIDDLIGAKA